MSELSDPRRRSSVRRVVAWRAGVPTERDDHLAGEEPMQILAAGPNEVPLEIAVTMRTPGNDAELAVGLLVSEGLIDQRDVVRVAFDDPIEASHPENRIVVHLARPLDRSAVPQRATIASASCGICGKASIADIVRRCRVSAPIDRIRLAALSALPDQLRKHQEVFGKTGALHAAAIAAVGADGDLEISTVREDVGRHNAVDKLIGEAALRGALPFDRHLLLLSGRCSFELVQKAGAAGIAAIASVGAPSDLAVETAERLGILLAGFLRGDAVNLYTRSEAIA